MGPWVSQFFRGIADRFVEWWVHILNISHTVIQEVAIVVSVCEKCPCPQTHPWFWQKKIDVHNQRWRASGPETILSFWPNNENYVISFMQLYWFVLLETRLNLNNIATLISFVSHFSSAIPSSYSDAAISCSCCSFKSASNLARSKSNFLMCLST